MKQYLIVLLALHLSSNLPAQFTANADSVYTFMKYNSIHHKRVNWEVEDQVFHAAIREARTLEDTLHCFVQVLEALGDVHSHFNYNQRYFSFWKPESDSVMKRVGPMLEAANSITNKPTVKLIAKEFLYARIPGYQVWDPNLIQEYAQSLHDSLTSYDPKKLKGVVIDLRWNTGGNVYPMLGGLSCLLNGSEVAYQTDMNDQVTDIWKIEGGDLTLSGTSVVKAAGKASKAWTKIPVVVLTGPISNSSGSLVAIAFKGRKSTTSMGESTAAGYTTCNGYFWFNDQLSFNFAVSHFADRNNIIYRESVPPDMEHRMTAQFDQQDTDDMLAAAIAWLQDKKARHVKK